MTTKELWGQITHVSLTMKTIVCGGCGIPFAIPENYWQKLVHNNGSFHCPNGCSRTFTGKTEADELREKVEQLEASKAKLWKIIERKNDDIDAINRQKSAVKGQLTKVKNRVKNGVCPCCNRTFTNLANHMKNQHPTFTPAPK